MWVVIYLEGITPFMIYYLIDFLKTSNMENITISFDTYIDSENASLIIDEILDMLKSANIKFDIGPSFIDNRLIKNNETISMVDFYLSSSSDRILWYLENYELNVDKVAIVISELNIEPLRIMKKRNELLGKYSFLYLYQDKLIDEIESLLDSTIIRIRSLKEKKG